MNTIKLIFQTLFQLVKKICLFPKTLANAAEQRRHRLYLKDCEAERLDRIRNPSKYLGI